MPHPVANIKNNRPTQKKRLELVCEANRRRVEQIPEGGRVLILNIKNDRPTQKKRLEFICEADRRRVEQIPEGRRLILESHIVLMPLLVPPRYSARAHLWLLLPPSPSPQGRVRGFGRGLGG
jgi:hypothetical protein